jgi:hypothetical protein
MLQRRACTRAQRAGDIDEMRRLTGRNRYVSFDRISSLHACGTGTGTGISSDIGLLSSHDRVDTDLTLFHKLALGISTVRV